MFDSSSAKGNHLFTTIDLEESQGSSTSSDELQAAAQEKNSPALRSSRGLTPGSSYAKTRSRNKSYVNRLADNISIEMLDTMKEHNWLSGEYLHHQDNKSVDLASLKARIRSFEGLSTRAKVLGMEACALSRDVRSFVSDLSDEELYAWLLEKDPESRMRGPQSYQVHERIVVSPIRLNPSGGSASTRFGRYGQIH